MPGSYLQKVEALCDHMVSVRKPEMKWMWGEALFGYALFELDAYRGRETYTPFLKGYCDYYTAHPPRVDCADTAAPALITYAMQKKTGNPGYAALTGRVLNYIRGEPRIAGDAVNHLGRSRWGRFYPKSIWVDSLMMFSVFPALYARETGDKKLLNFAARQPALYARYLQNPADGLWAHSYWFRMRKPHPSFGVYWARGNGWVTAALPMILDCIGPAHPRREEIRRLLERTAAALLPCQHPDGSFSTILGTDAYRELSATALIAAGMLHGVRCGYLQEDFLAPAVRAFRAVADSIRMEESGVFLPEISAPTIPLPVFPALCYRLTPRGDNWPYGVAAAVFAAIEYDRMEKAKALNCFHSRA